MPQLDLAQAVRSFDAKKFVARHGGYKESLSDASHEWLLVCPGCGSDRLRWNSQKATWICWGHPLGADGRSGDTIELIMTMEGCDEHEAIKSVLDGYVGGDSPIRGLTGKLSAPRPKLRVLPEMPWPGGVDCLTSPCEPHRQAWSYLASRGIPEALVRSYGLGYGRAGRLSNYIIFPVHMDHAMVFWQGRAAWDPPEGTKAQTKHWIQMTGYRKTLNPVAYENSSLATGRDALFNYDQARQYKHIVICEGPVDAMKVGANAVALIGKVGQEEKVERLRRLPVDSFTIYLDNGPEERAYALALAQELAPYAPVCIATPPEDSDAGKLTPEQNAAVIQRAVRFTPDKLDSGLI